MGHSITERKSPTLTEIWGKLALGQSLNTSLQDWATQRLVDGEDTPSLRVLAGLFGEEEIREAIDYLRKVENELGLVRPTSEISIKNYIREQLDHFIRNPIEPELFINRIGSIYVDYSYEAVFPFHEVWYALSEAVDCFGWDEAQLAQYYYHGIRRDNITRITLQEARLALAYWDLDVPEQIIESCYCESCYSLGKPHMKRSSSLPDFLHRLIHRRSSYVTPICLKCGVDHPLPFWNRRVRILYLKGRIGS